jgi:23S rRNA pseudouridine2605 synthase
LRHGIEVDGERFQPMIVILDRHQGANAWLTVGLREGKNREIRRAINAIGLIVNRLIRVSYGPFRLGELKPGDVEEVRPKVLRDQLGESPDADPDAKPARRTAQLVPKGSASAKRERPAPDARPARAVASKAGDTAKRRVNERPAPSGGTAPKPMRPARNAPAKGASGKPASAKPSADKRPAPSRAPRPATPRNGSPRNPPSKRS